MHQEGDRDRRSRGGLRGRRQTNTAPLRRQLSDLSAQSHVVVIQITDHRIRSHLGDLEFLLNLVVLFLVQGACWRKLSSPYRSLEWNSSQPSVIL